MGNTLVFNKKGGVGKTSISVTLAAQFEGVVITNDSENGLSEVYRDLIEPKKIELIEIAPNQKEMNLPDDKKLVFDFGGFVDQRVASVASYVDVCIIPICFESRADLEPSIRTIKEISKYNKKIIIVINKTEKKKAEELEKTLKKAFEYKVMILPKTNFMNRLADEGKTVFDLSKESGLNRHHLDKTVKALNKIIEWMK